MDAANLARTTPDRRKEPPMKDPNLGFTYDDNGKTTIHTTTLRMFADVKLRRYEPLLQTDLVPRAREIAETLVAALRAIDAVASSTLTLAEELASEG
jgi:hypothetical protein